MITGGPEFDSQLGLYRFYPLDINSYDIYMKLDILQYFYNVLNSLIVEINLLQQKTPR